MRVALFVTCLVDQLYPQVGVSTVRLLRRLGCSVTFPRAQTCCGQPAMNAGYTADARAAATAWLDAFEDAEWIVTPSGSCGGMVHHGFSSLFAADAALSARASSLAERTHEISSFLVNVLGRVDLGGVLPGKATFHPSCHAARLLGVRDEPLRLMREVRGLDVVPLDHSEDCCGFGGAFSVKLDAISAAMASEKAANVERSGARMLVSTDMGCLMQIVGFMRRQGHAIEGVHLAELLDRATSPTGANALGGRHA